MNTIIIISANAEWKVIRSYFPDAELHTSPMGTWFLTDIVVAGQQEQVIFFHGGWGKISAAASAQYVIDHWSPALLINLGTCGGFDGVVEKGSILLVERTIVYDIIEMMNDNNDDAIADYSTTLDLSWLGDEYPHTVTRTLLVSADRDIQVDDIPHLKTKYGAIAGDWESGAIAYVASRNSVRCLILRGVTDLVGTSGEAYGNIQVFVDGTKRVFEELLHYLPAWIERAAD